MGPAFKSAASYHCLASSVTVIRLFNFAHVIDTQMSLEDDCERVRIEKVTVESCLKTFLQLSK